MIAAIEKYGKRFIYGKNGRYGNNEEHDVTSIIGLRRCVVSAEPSPGKRSAVIMHFYGEVGVDVGSNEGAARPSCLARHASTRYLCTPSPRPLIVITTLSNRATVSAPASD